MKLLDTMMRRFVKTGTLRIIDADGVAMFTPRRPNQKSPSG